MSANVCALPGDTLLYPAYRVVQRQGVRIAITGFTTPGAMVWDRDQLGRRVRVAPIERGRRHRRSRPMRREADVVGGPGPFAGSTAGPRTIRPASAARTSAAALAAPAGPSRRRGGGPLAPGDARLGARAASTSSSRDRSAPASRWCTSIWRASEDGPWRVRRIRADLVSTARRRAVAAARAAAGRGARLGARLGPHADRARDRLRCGPEPPGSSRRPSSTSCRTCSAGAPARSSRAASAFDLRAGFDADTIRVGARAGALPLREHPSRRADQRRAAQGVSRVERALLPGGRRSDGSRSTTRCRATTTTSSAARRTRSTCGGRSASGSRASPCAGGRWQPADSFTMAVNSYRQTGGGGYDMLRGAPVVYDKGERIPELLIDAVRTRSPIDPARVRRPAAGASCPRSPTARSAASSASPPRRCRRAARDTVVLRILATGDLHGALLPGAGAAGRRRSTAWRDACDCPQLRLDAGDAMQGTPLQNETAGRAGIELLGRLGYAAAALGDHDFDWSVDVLRQRMAESAYPWLAANVLDSATGRRPDWITPYRHARRRRADGRGDRLHYARHQAACCPRTGPAGSASAKASWRCTTCSARWRRAGRRSRSCWRTRAARCDAVGLHRRDRPAGGAARRRAA